MPVKITYESTSQSNQSDKAIFIEMFEFSWKLFVKMLWTPPTLLMMTTFSRVFCYVIIQ